MRKIREILRLKWECQCSNHLIASSIGVSSSTVSECLRRVKSAKLSWPLPADLGEEALNARLYPVPRKSLSETRGKLDWHYVHQELKRKHVTLMLLWQEYKTQHPKGISYSQYCKCYRDWRGELAVWMRQTHKVGEKCFVDYAGMQMPIIIDAGSGEIRHAAIFIATLGASNFTYAEATWTQSLPDWIGSHVRAFEFFGGVPEIIVPDNLRSGVHKAHRYEPDLNPSYQDMACHYGVAIVPTRVVTPRDKAKVENAVLQVERQILAKLRDRTFFNLHALNQAVGELLITLNQRPFQKLAGSRQSQFDTLEKPALRALPSMRYEFAEWKKARAGADYHVALDNHFYSVPYTFIKKELDVRYTQKTVEIFYKNKRIASHVRSYTPYQHSTCKAHMPKRHQWYAEWTPDRILRWAEKTGTATALVVETIMQSRAHPQQGFRSCFGILRLSKRFGKERLESACLRALEINAFSYKSIESILKNGLDQQPLPQRDEKTTVPTHHEFVRGENYFN